MTRRPAETHLLVVWEHGRFAADRIVADVARRFTVVAGFEVTWSRRSDARHFSRLYGQSLPPGSDKAEHCGLGPFLLLVVRDEAPRYGGRRKWGKRVVVNTHLFDAKERYRAWTGGHRVHNSTDQDEADRDLFVLLGRRREEFEEAAAPWDGRFVPVERDPAGTDGWSSRLELLTAVDLTLPSVTLPAREPGEQRLRLLVEASYDHWGVEWLVAAPADLPLAQRGPDYELVVAGEPTTLELHRIGDGDMPAAWQQALLDTRVRDADGVWVPAPEHAGWALLHAVASAGRTPSADQVARLTEVLPTGLTAPLDVQDADAVAAALADHVAGLAAAPVPPQRRAGIFGALRRSTS